MSTPRLRATFSLIFPELAAKEAVQCFEALHGLLTSGTSRLFGVSSLVLEVEAGPAGLIHRIRVADHEAAYVSQQIRTLIPGVRVTPTSPPPSRDWTRVVELGIHQPDRALHIDHAERVSASLLASLTACPPVTVLLQWIMSPAPHGRPLLRKPPRIRGIRGLLVVPWDMSGSFDGRGRNDRRAKLSESTFLAACRIAVHSDSEGTARAALNDVRRGLVSVHTADSYFYARSVRQSMLRRRTNEARTPFLFGIRLSAAEAAALSGWPLGAPHVAGLPQARTRHLAPTAAIPSRGLVLASASMPGAERPLAISAETLCRNLHIVGPVGTGKTALLLNIGVQLMRQGFGLISLETKRDLFLALLEHIPKSRLDDVIVLDLADSDYPVGFNLLAEGNPRATVEHLCGLFERLYNDTRGVWTREVLYHGLSTLVSRPGYAFPDLVPLLAPTKPAEEAWRRELIDSLTDPELGGFWERYLAQPRTMQDRIAQPVLDRVWQLNARPEIRRVIGQSKSSFRMSDVIAQGKILLINLSGLGSTTASLAGTLLLGSCWRAIQSTRHERPIALLLDEFHDHIQFEDPAELLTKARSFGLGLALAHQNLGQLPPDLRSIVLANAHSKVVFQTSADDARTFAREFGRSVTEADFLNLGRFEVLCRIATDAGVSPPVTGTTNPPPRSTGLALEARTLSRERYSRPAHVVDAEIAGRRTPQSNPSVHRPRLGGQEWG